LAEAEGLRLSTPVFAKDGLEGILYKASWYLLIQTSRWGLQVSTIDYTGRWPVQACESVILGSVVGTHGIQKTWKLLTKQLQAVYYAIERVCSDEVSHFSGPPRRKQSLPGWHEFWLEVEKLRDTFLPGRRSGLDSL